MDRPVASPTSLKIVPGLVLTAALTLLAYLLDRVPGLHLLGTLGIALVLGLAWRGFLGLPGRAAPGARFSARTLLNAGVILLGVRLDFVLLYRAGPAVLLLDLLVVTAGLLVMERVGKWWGLSRGLRLALAVGSSICGASAIAASVPVIKATDDEVSVAVGVVSVLGTLGVLGYGLLGPLLAWSPAHYGLMTGATLHAVGHVLAAGAAQGAEALDVATLTKLTRVALLAPVLLVLGALLRRRDAALGATVSLTAKRPPLVPGFLVGFLALGLVNSLGLIPPGLVGVLETLSVLLTAMAMVGIGLGVDFGVLRRIGGGALRLGVVGFAAILLVAGVYAAFVQF